MLLVAEEVRAPPNGHFRDGQSELGVPRKTFLQQGFSLLDIPKTIRVRMMGEVGSRVGWGGGAEGEDFWRPGVDM